MSIRFSGELNDIELELIQDYIYSDCPDTFYITSPQIGLGYFLTGVSDNSLILHNQLINVELISSYSIFSSPSYQSFS